MYSRRNADQVEKECMEASAEPNWRQNAEADPVWAQYELLVEHSHKLQTEHTSHLTMLSSVFRNQSSIIENCILTKAWSVLGVK